MDDTAQNQPTEQPVNQTPPVIAPTPASPASPQGVQRGEPVSSPNREHEPAPFPDVSKMSETQIQKEEKELEKQIEAIAEKSPADQQPVLDEEIKRVGVALSEEAVKEPSTISGSQPLPITFDQAKLTRKKYNWRNSVAWLATLIMYHWKKLKTKEI